MSSGNKSSKLVVAIDGGGSKVAVAAISTDDALIHWPTVPEDCPYTVTIEGTGAAAESSWLLASENIRRAINSLCDSIGCKTRDIELLLLALSGAGRPADRDRVLQWTVNEPELALIQQTIVVGDIDPIVRFQSNATAWQPSMAVIVGTGSIVASQLPNQPLIRAGGWGPILGDEASGWAIAREALRAACSWLDSASIDAPPNALLSLIVEHLSLDNRLRINIVEHRTQLSEAILSLANDRRRAAQLAPKILHLAYTSSDSLAARIVNHQIDLLTEQILTVYAQAQMKSTSWNLLLSGGLICNHAAFQTQLLTACAQRGLQPCRIILVDPLVATLQFATHITRQKHQRH